MTAGQHPNRHIQNIKIPRVQSISGIGSCHVLISRFINWQQSAPEVYFVKTRYTSCREVREAPQASFAFSARFWLPVWRRMNW